MNMSSCAPPRSALCGLAAVTTWFAVGCAARSPMSASAVALESAPEALSPPKTARIRHLARGHNAYVGHLELDAGARVPLHRDASEEFIYILEGGGRMTIDGQAFVVGPGMTIYMPANAEVSFDNGETKTVGLQIFAGPASADKYQGWTSIP